MLNLPRRWARTFPWDGKVLVWEGEVLLDFFTVFGQ